MARENKGAARYGTHRAAFESARKKIYSTQSVCGICGLPVDFALRYPHPMSACIDHIVPLSKGGHPSDMDNLQLAHWICNRLKSDKLTGRTAQTTGDDSGEVDNRNLPQSIDWRRYRPTKTAAEKSASLGGAPERPKRRITY